MSDLMRHVDNAMYGFGIAGLLLGFIIGTAFGIWLTA